MKALRVPVLPRSVHPDERVSFAAADGVQRGAALRVRPDELGQLPPLRAQPAVRRHAAGQGTSASCSSRAAAATAGPTAGTGSGCGCGCTSGCRLRNRRLSGRGDQAVNQASAEHSKDEVNCRGCIGCGLPCRVLLLVLTMEDDQVVSIRFSSQLQGQFQPNRHFRRMCATTTTRSRGRNTPRTDTTPAAPGRQRRAPTRSQPRPTCNTHESAGAGHLQASVSVARLIQPSAA